MIIEELVTWALGIVTWIIELAPADSISWPDGSELGAIAAEYAGPFNSLLPLEETAMVLELTVTLIVPVTLSLRVTQWIYFLLPVVK